MSDTQQVLTVEEQLRKALLAIVERAPSTKPEPPIDDWGHYRGSGNEGDIADHVRDWERWEAAEIAGGALFDTRPDGAVDASPKFDKTWCSNCGREFGPGDHGYSHCDQHTPQKPEPSPSVEEERKRGRIPERGTDARDDYYYGLGLQAGAAAESHGEETSFTKIIEDATREPSPSGSETGWVIERGNSDPSEPKYWAAGHSDADRMIAWTSNHMAAIRFSRREDAEAVWKRLFPDIQVRICDHAWGAPPSPSVEPPQSSYADLFGYFDNPAQIEPAYDPGFDVPCPCCLRPVGREGIKTISLMGLESSRSYFFRAHKACWETASEQDKQIIESSLIDAEKATP